MTKPIDPRARQLANALKQRQKQAIKTALLGTQACQHQHEFIQFCFQHAQQITLAQAINLEQLLGVVEARVFQVNLAAPLLSTIGEMVQNIHDQLSHSHSVVGSLVSDQQVEHWARKILELNAVFDYIKEKIQQTPQIQALCAYWINQNIQRYTPEKLSTTAEYTVRHLPQKVQQRLLQYQQRIEEMLEEKTAHLFQKQLLSLLSLPKEEYLSLVMAIWRSNKDKPISEFVGKSTAIDVEDFFILIYEFWKDLRHNTAVQNVIQTGVRYFYQAYADESVFYLFSSTGLTVQDILQENDRFIPKLLQNLEQFGVLDQLLDRYLSAFFDDEAVYALIEDAFQADNAQQP